MIIHKINWSLRKSCLKNYFINSRIIYRCQNTCYSQLSTCQKQKSKPQLLDDNWSQIYKLPIIPWVAAFNRLKIYQGGLTAIGIPVSFTLELSSVLSDHAAIVVSILGITGLITLTLGSLVTKNIIGIVYINHKTGILKLSYVDFWGLRKNIQLTIDDIIPSYEVGRKFDFYQTINTKVENGIKFKLLQRFGHISDRPTFTSIFGD